MNTIKIQDKKIGEQFPCYTVAEAGANHDGSIEKAFKLIDAAIEGKADLVVTPYHDVGLAVLKTLARDEGVNVTAGLPFPRTSPDHGTAIDIAGTKSADPGAMRAAIDLCIRFCSTSVSTL